MIQLTSQVSPPSAENACSQRVEVSVMFDQMNRTMIGCPLKVSSARNVPMPSRELPTTGGSSGPRGLRASSHQIDHLLGVGVEAAKRDRPIGPGGELEDVVVDVAGAPKQWPGLGGAFEFLPFGVACEAFLQPTVVDVPLAHVEVEVAHARLIGAWHGNGGAGSHGRLLTSGLDHPVVPRPPVRTCQEYAWSTTARTAPASQWDQRLLAAGLELLDGPRVAVRVAEAEQRAAVALSKTWISLQSTPRSTSSWRASAASATHQLEAAQSSLAPSPDAPEGRQRRSSNPSRAASAVRCASLGAFVS